ncbi:MAG: bifunctional glutamate N-acetyltransferase/amino-acid acetyltransferase ArgJ [Methylococcales bacterium]|nr:bifunctional glutamate N-acetyltransferase/amino-acid acetyltransferase ArgJ [Methylococcales bacterium]
MAVNQPSFPKMNPVAGISLGTTNAGIKQTERDDLLVMQMVEGGSCAAVFTQNAFCAAPVHVAKAHLDKNPRWLVINSGNANAGTGQKGMDDALKTCHEIAALVGEAYSQVLPFSTGVIGESLPIEKMTGAFPDAIKHLNETHWQQAATAIMTTDTFAKGVSNVIEIEGETITITGISKGAGMIQPNMATMLGFMATDAKIAPGLLQQCLSDAAELSFNRITIDGDTSTNDACVLMASGCSKAAEITAGSEAYTLFSTAIKGVCQLLAEAIVRDGEGATKFIRIQVEQALSKEEALAVGKTVAHSPLVKTAFFASDPNWGRILAAVGRAGVQDLDVEKIEIYLDAVCIVEKGCRALSYTESAGQSVMNKDEIDVTIKLGRGEHCETILTCDFSYDYVKINAEYRT